MSKADSSHTFETVANVRTQRERILLVSEGDRPDDNLAVILRRHFPDLQHGSVRFRITFEEIPQGILGS